MAHHHLKKCRCHQIRPLKKVSLLLRITDEAISPKPLPFLTPSGHQNLAQIKTSERPLLARISPDWISTMPSKVLQHSEVLPEMVLIPEPLTEEKKLIKKKSLMMRIDIRELGNPIPKNLPLQRNESLMSLSTPGSPWIPSLEGPSQTILNSPTNLFSTAQQTSKMPSGPFSVPESFQSFWMANGTMFSLENRSFQDCSPQPLITIQLRTLENSNSFSEHLSPPK